MLNYKELVAKEKCMVIAPAGYGKTHTISECLLYTSGKQLILTHTHAGVASIKEKIKNAKIHSSSYHVETITSYAQKYVNSFYIGDDIPDQENGKNYFPFIIEKATQIFKIKPITEIIRATYCGLFVDEYQDCNLSQHNLIKELSNLLPTRILGDYLQGIFGFTGDLVDLNNSEQFRTFINNKIELTTPWRWKKANNDLLGNQLKKIRKKLINKESLDLNSFNAIEFVQLRKGDLRNFRSDYYRKIWSLVNEKSLLIIHPQSANIIPRIKFVQSFKNNFRLLESIDDKKFYSLAKKIDDSENEHIIIIIKEICLEIFNKTEIKKWFNDRDLKRKSKQEDKILIEPIKNIFDSLKSEISFSKIAKSLDLISKLPGIICYRKEIFNNITSALIEAKSESLTVLEAMKKRRNKIRVIGRKVYGKCIGTTLLTKGLEFETVVILNAHTFDCPKHLYVALTRASKRLIVISEQNILRIN
jgi:DNA helicase-2/ATP-dependent DNA helicase PcrA